MLSAIPWYRRRPRGSSPPSLARRARDVGCAAIVHVHHDVEEVQPDAGDQDRHGHQGHRMAARCEAKPQHGALVATERALDALQRNRVHVPGVARHIGHALDRWVVRRMEAVVHARGQEQRDVGAVAIGLDQRQIDQQILEPVGKALGLEQFGPPHRAAGADDPVAGTDHHRRSGVQRPRAGTQLAREAVAQASEDIFFDSVSSRSKPGATLQRGAPALEPRLFDAGRVRREASTYQRLPLPQRAWGCAMRGLGAPAVATPSFKEQSKDQETPVLPT